MTMSQVEMRLQMLNLEKVSLQNLKITINKIASKMATINSQTTQLLPCITQPNG